MKCLEVLETALNRGFMRILLHNMEVAFLAVYKV